MSSSHASGSGFRVRRSSITIPVSAFPKERDIWLIKLVDHTGSVRVARQNDDEDTAEDTIVCESLATDFDDIKETFMMLTDEQRKFVMHVYYLYNHIKNMKTGGGTTKYVNDTARIILQGPAGTGKSTVINFIEKLVTWKENKTSNDKHKLKVLKCAFTGKAAANIEGYTLNNMLSIPFYRTRSLQKSKLDPKKSLLENCVFFICDEISMVGEVLMESVNMRLKQIFDNEELYGGRLVLLAGDLYQIEPVRQKSLYPNSVLWRCCDYYEFKQFIRQRDSIFTNALINFRDGKMTEKDISLLRSRETVPKAVPSSVIHIFYLNKHVNHHNTEILDKSTGEEEIVNNIVDEKLIPATLRVKVGLRYMITYNMDVGDGLANGTTGVVKGFEYDVNGKVSVIWMAFNTNIGRKTRSDYYKNNPGPKPGFEKFVPICQASIAVKLKSDPIAYRKVPNMFPLIVAEAITVHKSQGQTFHEGVCVHVTEDSYDKLRSDKSLQYVALTRVTKVEDLYIVGKLNYSDEKNSKIERVAKELNRLRTERSLKLAYETFENQTEDVLIYLNTGLTFKHHYQFIATDKWYDNGSLLIFTETNTNLSDKIEIPHFERDINTTLKSEGRLICFKKPNKSINIINSTTDQENTFYLALMLYEKYQYILVGIQNNLNNDRFISAIQELLHYIGNKKCIFFMTTCKTDPAVCNNFDVLNFKKIRTSEVLELNNEKHCDMVLVRDCDIQERDVGFYEYIPSPHKSIYVKLQNFNLPQNNHEAHSQNRQQPCSSHNIPATDVTAHSSSQAWISNNIRHPAASAISDTSTAEVGAGHNKRPIADGDSSFQTYSRKKVKEDSQETFTPENMVIIPVDYPAQKIQKNHLPAIQATILKFIAIASYPLPRIIIGDIVYGALHITCQEKDASTWITSIIQQDEVAGLRLKVLALSDLPKPVRMIWTIMIIGTQDIRVNLQVLQMYNTLLNTNLWEIENTLTLDTHTEHTILVDQESADIIEACGFKLFDGIGYSSFVIKEVKMER